MENKDCWRTPPILFGKLNDSYRFIYDMAASNENKLCDKFFTIDDDSLSIDWPDEWKWCNPPYSNPLPWVQKAAESGKCVMLLNQDTSTKWFRVIKERAERIIFLTERVRFVRWDTLEVGKSNNKCQMIIVFGDKDSDKKQSVEILSIDEL